MEHGAVTDSPGDLDSIRRILFGADLQRLEQALAGDRDAFLRRVGDTEQKVDKAFQDLEGRVNQRLEELGQKVSAQLEDLARRQQAHADRVAQLMDQVMAELTRRSEAMAAETKAGLDEMRARTVELERRKLNVAEFGASLASLGQRFSAASEEAGR
jgi:DNA anti-recombination protein RmuC